MDYSFVMIKNPINVDTDVINSLPIKMNTEPKPCAIPKMAIFRAINFVASTAAVQNPFPVNAI